MGAGPYKFVKYENRIVYFEANENYFKGEPITKYVQFKETIDSEIVAGLAAGTVDVGDMNGSRRTTKRSPAITATARSAETWFIPSRSTTSATATSG